MCSLALSLQLGSPMRMRFLGGLLHPLKFSCPILARYASIDTTMGMAEFDKLNGRLSVNKADTMQARQYGQND